MRGCLFLCIPVGSITTYTYPPIYQPIAKFHTHFVGRLWAKSSKNFEKQHYLTKSKGHFLPSNTFDYPPLAPHCPASLAHPHPYHFHNTLSIKHLTNSLPAPHNHNTLYICHLRNTII